MAHIPAWRRCTHEWHRHTYMVQTHSFYTFNLLKNKTKPKKLQVYPLVSNVFNCYEIEICVQGVKVPPPLLGSCAASAAGTGLGYFDKQPITNTCKFRCQTGVSGISIFPRKTKANTPYTSFPSVLFEGLGGVLLSHSLVCHSPDRKQPVRCPK